MGYTAECISCETAMTQGPSRGPTEQGRTRIIKAMSSDVDLSVRSQGSAQNNVTFSH